MNETKISARGRSGPVLPWKLAVYKLPREVEFVDRMPRPTGPGSLGTGKLLRRLLLQREQDKAQVREKS